MSHPEDWSEQTGELPGSQDEIILRAQDLTKVFPGTVALNHVDFKVYRGKVNVLIGENGAGKSTLMKIIAGVETPTSGRLILEGKEIVIRSPKDAAANNIGIIYQEIDLFPNLSVTENIFMGREKTRRGVVIDRSAEDEIAREILTRLEQEIDPHTLVGNLRLGQQQIVEIARALQGEVRILIMDEPTSALSNAEVDILFRVIRELKSQGVSIIYISHKLDELLRIGDYVTVLRDGHLMAEAPVIDIDIDWIVAKMVGRNLTETTRAHQVKVGKEILRVDKMSLPRVGGGYILNQVSLKLDRGEILGIYGLLGAGRTELLESIMGLHPEVGGKLYLDGRLIQGGAVGERIEQGIVLIPEDRQVEGIIPTLSVNDNMILSSLARYWDRFYLSLQKEKRSVGEMIRHLSLKVSSPDEIVTSLSGGNQQKVVVARGLMTLPKVLLMDEPTRGIDIGAKSEMFEIMSRLAGQGLGIIFVSSELDEVLAMSDRILVLSKGQITGEFNRGAVSETDLVSAASARAVAPAREQGVHHEPG